VTTGISDRPDDLAKAMQRMYGCHHQDWKILILSTPVVLPLNLIRPNDLMRKVDQGRYWPLLLIGSERLKNLTMRIQPLSENGDPSPL
jgi:hypothetical protein